MSNTVKMSLEERIVQTLKDDTIMKLVDDEDAVTDLVIRAIREALFQPKRVAGSYGSSTENDAPVVAAARSAAKTYAETVAKQCIDELIADPKNHTIIHNAIIDMLPSAISEYLRGQIGQLLDHSKMLAHNEILTMKRNNLI